MFLFLLFFAAVVVVVVAVLCFVVVALPAITYCHRKLICSQLMYMVLHNFEQQLNLAGQN